MNAANTNGAGPDTIGFAQSLSGQTITLGAQLPTITDSSGITIEGGSANITISGNDKVRVFAVGEGGDLTLNKLTVAHGSTTLSGGAIDNSLGTLTVDDSTLSANHAGQGGGISNNVGFLTVVNSTLSGNSAGLGGGIYNSGVVTVISSTLSGNVASGTDKGFGGGIYNSHEVDVSSSTLSGNSATASQGGGGIFSEDNEFGFSVASLSTTIVANSTAGGNCQGPVGDDGLNLDSGTSCGFSPSSTSKSNTDPKLDPNGLQNNGGPTKTIALQPGSATQQGSPAIDAIPDTDGTTAGCDFSWPTDQRGVARPQGSACDIGAFELDATPPSVTINTASGQADSTSASPIHFTVVFSEPVTGFTGSDVTLSGTAGATTAVVSGGPTTYDVAVSGMATGGTVIASIAAGVAKDIAQNGNSASTSTDNTVTFIPNSPPTAVIDSYSTNEDTPLSVDAPGVLANDTDDDSDPLTAVLVSGPSHAATNGFTLNQDGSFSYTPASNYNGPDSFTYKANDGTADSKVATANIKVAAVDDPPTAVNDQAAVQEDSVPATAIDVLANDTDGDGGSKTIQSVTQPTNGAVVITDSGSGLTYEPNADYCNDPPATNLDTFTYTLNGGSQGTVSMKVTCVNDPPAAVDDSATTNEDTTVAIDVKANDTDGENDNLGVVASSLSDPANGTVSLITSGTNEGKVLYKPDQNYNNTAATRDTFTYKVNDGQADSNNAATVSVKVDPVNDAPSVAVAAGGACATNDRSGTINLTVSDPDGQTQTGSLKLSATSKNTALVPNANLTIGGSGASRTLTATALSGKTGTATINLTVTDADKATGTPLALTLQAGGNSNDTLNGTSQTQTPSLSGTDILLGQNGDDVLNGSGADDLLCGGLGNDTLKGQDGSDTLSGGLGNDRLEGGNGDDKLTGGSGADSFSGGSGIDTATDYNTSQGDTKDTTIP